MCNTNANEIIQNCSFSPLPALHSFLKILWRYILKHIFHPQSPVQGHFGAALVEASGISLTPQGKAH